MPREKTVFETDRIAHIWWYGERPHARNQADNYYFSGDTIFSYGRHFPIARKFQREGFPDICLFTRRTYSNTTSKHIYLTRRAIPNGRDMITVTDIKEDRRYMPFDWESEVRGLLYELGGSLQKQIKARTANHMDDAQNRLYHILRLIYYFDGYLHPENYSGSPASFKYDIINPDWYVGWNTDDILRYFNPYNGAYVVDNVIDYFAAVMSGISNARVQDDEGAPRPLTQCEAYEQITAGTFSKLMQEQFIAAFGPAEGEMMKFKPVEPKTGSGRMGPAQREKIERKIAKCHKDIADWYAGRYVSSDERSYDTLRALDPTLPEGQLLRIKPDDPTQVETNWGMTVARKDAFLMYRWLRACKERGAPPATIPKKFAKIGYYDVIGVRKDFSVKIGCHDFKWPAIEKLAEMAEWELALTSEE